MVWVDCSLKQHIKGVNFLVVNEKGEVLIQKRDQNTKKYPGALCIPGGGIEPGEYPQIAVVRECYEETGLKICPTDFVHFGNFCYIMDKKLRVNSLFIVLVENPIIKSGEGEMIWMNRSLLMRVTELARGEEKLFPEIDKFLRALLP
jgi:mutator protein MutT